MSFRFAIFLLTMVASPLGHAVAQQAFPYKAYIAADETYVRSGPGERFYPTDKLAAGTTVEVYRHDPGGWYAIRPPEGSFSWVGAQFLRPTGDGVAEVVGRNVAVRVGTRLTDQRDTAWVRVRHGEVVELLDGPQPGGDRSATWYKIAPPSGEFRWVRGSEVDMTVPQAGGTQAAKAPAPPSPLAPAQPSLFANPARPRTSEEFQKELDDITTELSIMLAEEPTAWNCGDLSRRAQTLLEQADSAVDRGRARMLVNRIAQSDDIRRRSAALGTAATDVDSRLGAYRSGAAAMPSALKNHDDRFDGMGRLARVQQAKFGAPRYALLDEQGSVKAYVSPAPGVSMQPYVGRQVGINGFRGLIPDQNAEHLTARRVTALDARLR